MAAILVGSGILLEYHIGLAVGRETIAYRIVAFVLDVTLVGCAMVWAVAAAVATWEAIISARAFVRRTRE